MKKLGEARVSIDVTNFSFRNIATEMVLRNEVTGQEFTCAISAALELIVVPSARADGSETAVVSLRPLIEHMAALLAKDQP